MKKFTIPLGVANLISSIMNWDKLSHDLHSTPDGWILIRDKRINIVKEIEKLPHLRYCMKEVASDDFYGTQYYVVVTDEVGQLIELYMKQTDDYAGLELNEFLSKTIKDANP